MAARASFATAAELEPTVAPLESDGPRRFVDPHSKLGRRYRGNNVVALQPSNFVERFIRIKDGDNGTVIPMSFKERRYLERPYNTSANKVMLMMSRQTEKSTTLGNKLMQQSAMRPMYESLFVTPSAMQTAVFSKARLNDIVDISPLMKGLTSPHLTNNILEKELINRSKIFLRYAYLTADRIRGLSVNAVFVDELQDILMRNMPVIEETASHHRNPRFWYSGTPKSYDNVIEQYWSKSTTMSEWVIPCRRHGTPKNPSSWHWNMLGEKNIGKTGPCCDKCGKPIDPEDPDAQWVEQKPNAEFEGYRICRLMVPWFFKNQEKWKTILQAYERYPRPQFFNEVLAISYDSGSKPITRIEVMNACDDKYRNSEEEVIRYGQSHPLYAGIDWGCYDEQTRTLTDRGFKYHWEIQDSDRVAQYDPGSGDVSYVTPHKKIVFDHKGNMVRFKTKTMDMLVTPDHKMLYRVGSRDASPWKECEAQDLVGKDDVRFREIGCWRGEREEFFHVAGRDVPMENWLRFLGLVLSEGFVGFSNDYRELSVSQRKATNHSYIERVFSQLGFDYRVRCTNKKTGDMVWTICGPKKDELWYWFVEHVGMGSSQMKIPRRFLGLDTQRLDCLLEALMLGDGSWDPRATSSGGGYSTTSIALRDGVLELLTKLGWRVSYSTREPKGNRKRKWAVAFSRNREFVVHSRTEGISLVPYEGKAYCFSVPSGYFVTERNGRVAQQGNSGENTYSVMSIGGYTRDDGGYEILYSRRYDGQFTDPDLQLEHMRRLIVKANVKLIGADYGQGFYQNTHLTKAFGPERVHKFQYAARSAAKLAFSAKLQRYIVFRSPVMADIFTALKTGKIRLPKWEDYESPYVDDITAIFQEYSDTMKMLKYDTPAKTPDDTFHSIIYSILASMLVTPRPDILAPMKEEELDKVSHVVSEDELAMMYNDGGLY